ncbi:NAD-dependent epimerase/dehydratase [Penicillium expansum]|nr:NAD-dependent epimerase/dehydratase [Penicillium expansum]
MGASDGRVVSSFIASALASEDLKITGDGTATRSFQYVTDCTQGLYALMQSGYNKGLVNIGVSIAYLPPLVDDHMVRRPDITLAREVLHWGPVIRLEDGLRRTIE